MPEEPCSILAFADCIGCQRVKIHVAAPFLYSCLGLFYLQARAAKSLATLAFNRGVFVEIVAIQNLQTIMLPF